MRQTTLPFLLALAFVGLLAIIEYAENKANPHLLFLRSRKMFYVAIAVLGLGSLISAFCFSTMPDRSFGGLIAAVTCASFSCLILCSRTVRPRLRLLQISPRPSGRV